ncbi:MAG TPA: polyprenyl synthetase family protein [Fimbriimonadaceae bacterium]|nr:polyprenyl synthetase family protein [Fimbriimonadaceae bacterium]HRJ96686.1 polyprenyl synthetase family protein [Fimbriimonadaceae bacterium]
MSLPTISEFDDLLGELRADVERVEAELATLIDSPVEVVRQVGSHTLAAGGKRLRPAFVSLAARATGRPYDPARAVRLGACLELIHMATLIHDDVIDQADRRRGRATASSLFGNTASILSGDAMLAKAMVVLADDGDLGIIRTVSRSVVEMAEGEAREVECRGRFDLDEGKHLEILRMKTAAFIECCCRVGAALGGSDRETTAALAEYGHHVGMAFQLVDDILDFRGDPDRTGKPRATDFKEGCATLPLIRLRAGMQPEEAARVESWFGNGVSEDDLIDLVALMDAHGTFLEAESTARCHVVSALTALQQLPDSPDRRLLASAAEFVVRRAS